MTTMIQTFGEIMTENSLEVEGIKEIDDIMVAVKALTLDCIIKFGDGFDISDISVLTDNLPAISEAIKGASNIADEGKDLSIAEIKEISSFGIDFIFDIVEAVKQIKNSEK